MEDCYRRAIQTAECELSIQLVYFRCYKYLFAASGAGCISKVLILLVNPHALYSFLIACVVSGFVMLMMLLLLVKRARKRCLRVDGATC